MAKSQKEMIRGIDSHLDDPFLHLSTVADALGRSPQTIGRWVADGAIPHVVQPGGMKKIRKSQLLKWLEVTGFGKSEGAVERVEALVE